MGHGYHLLQYDASLSSMMMMIIVTNLPFSLFNIANRLEHSGDDVEHEDNDDAGEFGNQLLRNLESHH